MPKTLLPDINVWLAMTFDSHGHHSTAKNWFDALTDEVCFFCRLTQQGFLRLATNQKVIGAHALTLDDAWQAYDAYLRDARIAYAEEPANIETQWRTFTRGQSFSTHVWNDAYLAAFAIVGGHELVTFDNGFVQYQGLRPVILP
ncbi:MAG: TA system VapC family ribonuclease toxin [Gemmataceae bacterium]